MKIEVYRNADAVAQNAAALVAAEARAAVAARGGFVMAVSGGHTPWQMLRALAGEEVPWDAVHVAGFARITPWYWRIEPQAGDWVTIRKRKWLEWSAKAINGQSIAKFACEPIKGGAHARWNCHRSRRMWVKGGPARTTGCSGSRRCRIRRLHSGPK